MIITIEVDKIGNIADGGGGNWLYINSHRQSAQPRTDAFVIAIGPNKQQVSFKNKGDHHRGRST